MRSVAPVLCAVLCAALCGCASLMSSVTEGLAEDMSDALLNTEDLQVAREGSAAFLIMLEGFLRSSPDSIALMQAGVTLNGAYATAFVDDAERQRRFAERAFEPRATGILRQAVMGLFSAHRSDIEVLQANLRRHGRGTMSPWLIRWLPPGRAGLRPIARTGAPWRNWGGPRRSWPASPRSTRPMTTPAPGSISA